MTITKQRYAAERSELKVEYGKDLNRITNESAQRDARMQNFIEI